MSIRSMATVAMLSVLSTGIANATDKQSDKPLTQNEVYTYVEGATIAIILHEVGHALIDIYQLPTVAEQEDVADEFAAMFIIAQARADENNHILADNMADFFYSYVEQAQRAEDGTILNFVYWNEHNLAERRAFNILCDMYGAFPDRYESKLRNIGASDDRLKRCISDYKHNAQSWRRLLKGRFRSDDEMNFMRSLTALGFDAAFQDVPRFRVTYTPSLSADESGWFQGNENLRYHLLTYIANLLTTQFKLTPIEVDANLAKGESRVGSIDIYSRQCGVANAKYSPPTRAVTICHELDTAMADAYIRYRTGEEPRDWWAARWLEEYSADAKNLVGVWKAEDGSRLVLDAGSLTSGGVFTIQGEENSNFAARHGRWGVEGDTLWLIETYRDGVHCFNPACRPNVTEGGLTAREQVSLRYGVTPRAETRGTFSVPSCAPSFPEPGSQSNELEPTDFSTKIGLPCDTSLAIEQPRAKIEIDGAVFQYIGNIPVRQGSTDSE